MSTFTSRETARTVVYDNNVDTVLFAHERTQIEDTAQQRVSDTMLNSHGSKTMFELSEQLLDENGDLVNADKIKKKKKSFIFNNAEGRTVITLSNMDLDDKGNVIKADQNSSANDLEKKYGYPTIISYSKYSPQTGVDDQRRQLNIGHPEVIASYAYDGSLDFDNYGKDKGNGDYEIEGSDFIMKLDNLKVVSVEDEENGEPIVSIVYTTYTNPNMNDDNWIAGVQRRFELNGRVRNSQAVAEYIAQMSGLRSSAFKSDGSKYFEIYNYALSDSPSGTFSNNTYESNLVSEKPACGFVI